MSFITPTPGSHGYKQLSMVNIVPRDMQVVYSSPVFDEGGNPTFDSHGQWVYEGEDWRDLQVFVGNVTPMEGNVTGAGQGTTPQEQDQRRFSEFASTQEYKWHRVWKGLYGETTDNDDRHHPTSIFVPAEDYKAALQITTARTNYHHRLADTQWETSMSGDLYLDEATHADLFSRVSRAVNFDYELDTSIADLGYVVGPSTGPDHDFKERYLRGENQPRLFRFQANHAMIQQLDQTSCGFKSTANSLQGGFPPRNTILGNSWVGEVETFHPKP